MGEAVGFRLRRCEQQSRTGPDGGPRLATVLLSPAAASFDMFSDYEARGAAFKAAVARLADQGEPARDGSAA